MDADFEQRIRLLFKEAYRHKVLIAVSFLVISLVVTVVGAAWPKSYSSSTTIQVEEKNIIDPEEDGRSADAEDRANTVLQVLTRRSVLERVLRDGGWINEDTPPREVEGQLEAFQGRMDVTSTATNMVRISFRDGDPTRAYETTQRLGEEVIAEMQGARTSQSAAAFEFIERQVQTYAQKLEENEQALASLREQNPLARQGAEEQMNERIAQLRENIKTLEQNIREAQSTERTLMAQLAGETEGIPTGGMDLYSSRLSDLREELSDLTTRYTDTHPDVVRLRRQIDELEAMAAQDDGQQQSPSNGQGQEDRLTQQMWDNPIFQDLQQQLYDTRAQTQRLQTRLEGERENLQEALQQEQDVQALRDDLERLTRVYNVNQDIHQDLLRRRENARVAMQLDDEQQPFTLRTVEPAYRPHEPSGPRLLQFAAGGIAAGASVPLSLLFVLLLVDPRVRMGASLPAPCSQRLLEVVPHVSTRRERIMDAFKLVVTVFIVLLGVGGVMAILLLRYFGQI